MLGQETNLSIITTLEQAFASVGTKALPALRQQNQSLSQQLQAIEDQTSSDYQLTAWRLRATKQAIAKILVLHNNQLSQVNLSRVDLNKDTIEIAPFTLIAEELDLSGINFENAQLSQARLKGSVFASAGQDKHEDTFDDLIANFKGANLTQADLSEAVLPCVSLVGANLQQTNLKRSNLKQANLQKANLSSVQLLQANLQQANLKAASLTGADLTQAQFNQANLEQANLGQLNAVGANFSEANLAKSNWQDSDLSGVNFTSANLEQADLSSTVLKGVNFRNAQLNNANLTDANLSQADLRSANLAGANFHGVIFSKVQFTNTNGFLKTPPNHQSEAIIKGVDFSEVKNLSPTQIDFICQKGGIHPQCIVEGGR